jgi:hypothetical protein
MTYGDNVKFIQGVVSSYVCSIFGEASKMLNLSGLEKAKKARDNFFKNPGGPLEVPKKLQDIFSKEHLPYLTKEKYREFLLQDNNEHWSNIDRHVTKTTKDMPKLREALLKLIYEKTPIEKRFDDVVNPMGTYHVHGLGKAQATAILMIVFPEQYGVWNQISQDCLKDWGRWPKYRLGESKGNQYRRINGLLKQLADELSNDGRRVNLWILDYLFWYRES